MSNESAPEILKHKDNRNIQVRLDYILLYHSESKAKIVRILETWTNTKYAEWYKGVAESKEQKSEPTEENLWVTMSYDQFSLFVYGTVKHDTIKQQVDELVALKHIQRRTHPEFPYGAPQYLLNKKLIQEELDNLEIPPNLYDLGSLLVSPKKKHTPQEKYPQGRGINQGGDPGKIPPGTGETSYPSKNISKNPSKNQDTYDSAVATSPTPEITISGHDYQANHLDVNCALWRRITGGTCQDYQRVIETEGEPYIPEKPTQADIDAARESVNEALEEINALQEPQQDSYSPEETTNGTLLPALLGTALHAAPDLTCYPGAGAGMVEAAADLTSGYGKKEEEHGDLEDTGAAHHRSSTQPIGTNNQRGATTSARSQSSKGAGKTEQQPALIAEKTGEEDGHCNRASGGSNRTQLTSNHYSGDEVQQQQRSTNAPGAVSRSRSGDTTGSTQPVMLPSEEKKLSKGDKPVFTDGGQRVYESWASLFRASPATGPKTIEAANSLAPRLRAWTDYLECSLSDLLKEQKGWLFATDKTGFYKRGVKLTDIDREFEAWQSAKEQDIETERKKQQKPGNPSGLRSTAHMSDEEYYASLRRR